MFLEENWKSRSSTVDTFHFLQENNNKLLYLKLWLWCYAHSEQLNSSALYGHVHCTCMDGTAPFCIKWTVLVVQMDNVIHRMAVQSTLWTTCACIPICLVKDNFCLSCLSWYSKCQSSTGNSILHRFSNDF